MSSPNRCSFSQIVADVTLFIPAFANTFVMCMPFSVSFVMVLINLK